MTNIVLITVDCLRYDRTGFNGHHRPTTPTLDEISAESHIYDNAFATGPWTPESFPGIMAGLHSYNSAYFDNPSLKAIPQNQPTIASILGNEGYETFAAISNPHLTRKRNFDKGFEDFINLRTGEQAENFDEDSDDEKGILSRFDLGDLLWRFRSLLRSNNQMPILNPFVLSFVVYRYYQYLTDWPIIRAEPIIDEFLKNIESTGTPFFGWTHLMDLHMPIHPESARKGELAKKMSNYDHFTTDAHRIGNVYDSQYEAIYDSTVRYIDDQIYRIISTLKNHNLWDKTILIVTADHGEALYDRGIYGHASLGEEFVHGENRHYMYDELLHVPLLIRIPNGESKRISTPFSLGWLHEVIQELTDVRMEELPYASGRSDPFSSEKVETPIIADAITQKGHTVTVRNEKTKFTRFMSSNSSDKGAGYRTYSDRGERAELKLGEIPIEHKQLVEKLFCAPSDLNSVRGEVSEGVDDLLKQLGYKA